HCWRRARVESANSQLTVVVASPPPQGSIRFAAKSEIRVGIDGHPIRTGLNLNGCPLFSSKCPITQLTGEVGAPCPKTAAPLNGQYMRLAAIGLFPVVGHAHLDRGAHSGRLSQHPKAAIASSY